MKTDYRKICAPNDSAFRLGHSPFYLMAHADFQYHEDVSVVLEKQGITKSMYRLLTVLREDQPAAITRLAERALIKRSTVSRIVEKMSEMGLVDSTTDSNDNRVTIVTLSDGGVAMLDRLTPVVAKQFQRAIDGFSSEEIERLNGLLKRINGNLSKLAIE